jgi:hypothetical protein
MNDTNNPPAFPFVAGDDTGMMINMGMTLRDYFAAKAMQSLIMGIEGGKEHQIALVPKTSYDIADAMMEARK